MTESHPLRIPVAELIDRPGESQAVDVTTSFGERVGEGLAYIAADQPLSVQGLLESVQEGIWATARVETRALAECARCLDDMQLPIAVDFGELFAYNPSEDSDLLVERETVDLEQIVRDSVVLALPFNPVCQPDCGGLNPETGEKLPPGTRWEPPGEIDPRWAALEGFLTTEDDAATEAEQKKE